jgi:hypothetical protein
VSFDTDRPPACVLVPSSDAAAGSLVMPLFLDFSLVVHNRLPQISPGLLHE